MARTKLSLKEKEAREAAKAAKAAEKVKAQQDKEAQRQQDKEAQKQQREKERAEREAERRRKEEERQQREAERAGIRRETEKVRLERERLKLEKEKERLGRVQDRDKEKTEKERERRSRQSEKERQGKAEDRSRNLMSSFLGVTLSTAANSREAADEAAGGGAAAAGDASTAAASPTGASSSPCASSASSSSACPSSAASATSSACCLNPDAVLPVFHPFQPKPCSVMAPLHRVPPANSDEIAVMDAAILGVAAAQSPDLLRVAARYRCPLPSLSASSLSSCSLHRRRRLFSFPPRRPLSRRLKLLQFHTSYRPAWFGFWPSSCLLSVPPWSQLRKDARLNYEVDSDDEWGEEPEGEELASEGDDDDEGGDAAALSSSREGRMRADGYEEADGFMVPEDEDGAAGGVSGGLLLTDAKITREKGGKVRVIIRPVIVGPYREGDALTPEVKELLRCSWRADGPIDVVWKKELPANSSRELTASKKRPASSAAASGDEQEKVKRARTDAAAAAAVAGSLARASESLATAVEPQQAAGGVFLPVVRKKEKKPIAPESTASNSSGNTAAIMVAAAAETSDAAGAASSGSGSAFEDPTSGASDLLSPPSACVAMGTDALPASSSAGVAARGDSPAASVLCRC